MLYVDDETKSLRCFKRAFGDQFRILTASSARDGLRFLKQHRDEIGVLMTDQHMPGEKGVWLLERTQELQPRIVRIMVTAHIDMDALSAAINIGLHKLIPLPWDPQELVNILRHALELFTAQLERDQLLQKWGGLPSPALVRLGRELHAG